MYGQNLKIGMLLLFLLIVSCSKDDNIIAPDTVNPDPNAGVDVQDFMWKAYELLVFLVERDAKPC